MIHPRDWYVEIQGQGPDLVLLHGLGASSFSWRHNRAALSRHFRVITPDLPGHGRSPAPPQGDYRIDSLLRGVLDFLDWHNLTTVALGGNSLGGGLSLLAAAAQPERIAALTLLAPAAAVPRVPFAFYPLRLPVLGYAVAALLGPWFLPLFMRLIYYDAGRMIPEAAAGYAPPYRDLHRRLALRQ
ncbi:MAG TPA: alpha/beta fold hydrolase, partial [Desulfobaccales bacterium]|nr:alpha/beta fold hydrolase [Desulfobaccales bacterium]